MSSVVSWTLFRAIGLCACRRAHQALRGAPLFAAAVAGSAMALPVLAFLAGRRLSTTVGPAVASDDSLALAFAVSLGLSGAIAGAAIAALAPGEASLGPQLRCAPVPRRALFVSLTALPVATAVVGLSAVAGLFLFPFTARMPGGATAAVVVLVGGVAAVGIGATLVEAGGLAARGSAAGPLVLAGVGGVWAIGAVAAGDGTLAGPLGYVAETLRDPRPRLLEPLAALGLAAVTAFFLWGLAVGIRPREPRGGGALRPLVRIPSEPRLALFAASLARIPRRRELRRHAASVLAIATGGGLLLDALLPGPGALPFAFSGGAAVLGAAIVPLAAADLAGESDWLWHVVPQPLRRVAVAPSLAACVWAMVLVGVATAPVALATSIPALEYPRLLAAAGLACAAAVLAGAAVPWRASQLPDQLASYAAFAVALGALWLALGALVPRAAAAGIPEALFAALAVGVALGVSLAAAAAAASRRAPR